MRLTQTVYLPTPITFETKREWNAKGYKVADLATMPEGYDNPAAQPEKPKPAKGKSNA